MNRFLKQLSIVGVGNIGFRYYEAILDIDIVDKINLVEQNIEALRDRIKVHNYLNKQINLYKNISEELLNSDLIIVSTNSGERFEVCKRLIDLGYQGDFILEKVLFPNIETLLKSKRLFSNFKSKIFVNQWMRKTSLKEILKVKLPFEISISSDNLGLLCNTVHYLDLFSEIIDLDELILDLDNSHIDDLLESKRKGYTELRGKLVWKDFSGSKVFALEDKANANDNRDIEFLVKDKINSKKFIYSGTQLNLVNTSMNYEIPYLSSHAKDSIIKILKKKDPTIPNFKISYKQHKLLFNSLSKLLNKNQYQKIKIT
tara:strand:+ start:1145 stop:2089 length:945 start_codon:yes stop_codon:yes gene_type:complete